MTSIHDTEKAEDKVVEDIDAKSSEGSTLPEIGDHPKLWPRSLKLMVLFNVCLMVFNGQFFAAGPATSLGFLVRDFHVGYPAVAPLISYTVLMIGLGSLIWIPTADVFGKRITLLVANVIFLAGCIWTLEAKSLNSLLGGRIMGGFGASASQAIGPAVIGDVFFERDYSKAVAVYSMSLCVGAQLGPLFAGHIAVNLDWRWIFKLITILVAVNIVTAIPFLPESTFTIGGRADATAASLDEQLAGSTERVPRQGISSAIRKNTLYLRYPHARGGAKEWFQMFARHFPFLVDPIVLSSAGLWGIVQSWVIVISVISAQLFSPPPFLFSPAVLGNWTGTSMVGIVLAFPIAGPLVDILSRKLSKIVGGHKPEFRLYSMVIPFIICSPGLLLFGFTFVKGSYVGPAVGFAMQAAGLTLVPSAVISYTIDSYPYHASEAVASINLLTHLMSFALSRTAPQWLQRVGVRQLFIDMPIIQWALFIGLTIPLLVFGPWIRKYTTALHARVGGNASGAPSTAQVGH
ncbi:major facilitator superfamily domain-containing protein [Paraphoma chrysanthemicola]|nr:major facilitator superfamily domain-containing protein [Paraphoma chrysanthemicola]